MVGIQGLLDFHGHNSSSMCKAASKAWAEEMQLELSIFGI